MSHVVSLLSVRAEAFAELLAEEFAESGRLLGWPGGRLEPPVKGLAWMDEDRLLGYLALAMDGPTVLLRRLFATRRGPAHAVETALLGAAIGTAFGFPQVRRVCGELLAVTPATLAWLQAGWPGQVRLRLLMETAWTPGAGAEPGWPLAPWRAELLPAAGELLSRAHAGAPGTPGDPGRDTPAAAARSLAGITADGACGAFEPGASFAVQAPGSLDLLGFVLASRMAPDRGHIAELAVAPEVQHRGLGRALLTRALGGLHGLGCRTTQLAVGLDHPGAVHLYRQLGFQEFHRFPELRLAGPALG